MFDRTRRTIKTVTGFAFLQSLWQMLRQSVAQTKKDLRHAMDDAANEKISEIITHERLMRSWGIEEKDKPKVIKGLRVAQAGIIFLFIMGVILFSLVDPQHGILRLALLFNLFCVGVLCCVYFLIYEWRIRLIQNKMPYVPFIKWLTM